MLLGKVVSNKFVSVKTKQCKLGNTKENRKRELGRVIELAGRYHHSSSSSISSSGSNLDSSQAVSVEIVSPRKRKRKILLKRISPIAKKRARTPKPHPIKGGRIRMT